MFPYRSPMRFPSPPQLHSKVPIQFSTALPTSQYSYHVPSGNIIGNYMGTHGELSGTSESSCRDDGNITRERSGGRPHHGYQLRSHRALRRVLWPAWWKFCSLRMFQESSLSSHQAASALLCGEARSRCALLRSLWRFPTGSFSVSFSL